MIFTESFLSDILLFGILFLILVHTIILMRKKRWFALDPLNTFWVGIFVVYVKGAIQNEHIFRSWHQDGVFELTLFWTLFGLIWVVIGYERQSGIRLSRKLPVFALDVDPKRFMLSGWLLVGCGFAGYWHLVNTVGSFEAWIAVPRGGTDWEMASGYIANLRGFLPIGITLLLFNLYLHPSSLLKKRFVWVLAAVMVLWLIYLGTRSRTIMMVLSILAAYYLPRRKNPSFFLMGILFLGVLVVTNFQQYYRGYFTNLSFNFNQIDMVEAYKVTFPGFLGGSHVLKQNRVSKGAEFNCVMSVVELVPEKVDYNYGYGFLELFTRPIPRAIWPGKIYPGLEATQDVLRKAELSTAYISGTNLLMGPAFTFIGHWYYVGGPIALCFGGLLTGMFFRTIRSYYDYNNDSHGATLIYSLLVPLGFLEASATPLVWVYTLPLAIFPLWIILKICRRKRVIMRKAFR